MSLEDHEDHVFFMKVINVVETLLQNERVTLSSNLFFFYWYINKSLPSHKVNLEV